LANQKNKAMKSILFKLMGRTSDLVSVQPVVALFIGGALLAVFFATAMRMKPASEPDSKGSLVWLLYRQASRFVWAVTLVALLASALALLRGYLHQTLAGFQRNHGRITEANYNAVQTIWGAEQTQGEIELSLYFEEEVVERIESEDLTKPAVLRKKTVRHDITSNPFLMSQHYVTLRQNPRKKGSALYQGYETDCRFHWRMNNPTDRELKSLLKFPLPAAGAIYNDLSATLNGQDILPQMQLKDGALLLGKDLKPNEPLDVAIAFKSRGMSIWYFQVRQPREIRDFNLTLNLPDLPKAKMNNPEGCMSPSEIKSTPDNQGIILTYRLDHAISSKGMGVALPTPPQPGATTNAVLAEVERGWLLLFAMLVLGMILAGVEHGVLLCVLFASGTACVWGLVGDLSDLLFGFWPTAILVLIPTYLFLAWLLTRVVASSSSKVLALQLMLYGIIYPAAAGLDSSRQTLYFNICALTFLALAAWQLVRLLGWGGSSTQPLPNPSLAHSLGDEQPA
jgi:hypothetical protein